jgi:hypothetical protein
MASGERLETSKRFSRRKTFARRRLEQLGVEGGLKAGSDLHRQQRLEDEAGFYKGGPYSSDHVMERRQMARAICMSSWEIRTYVYVIVEGEPLRARE